MTNEKLNTNVGPYPEPLAGLIRALTYKPGWEFELRDVGRGLGRAGGHAAGGAKHEHHGEHIGAGGDRVERGLQAVETHGAEAPAGEGIVALDERAVDLDLGDTLLDFVEGQIPRHHLGSFAGGERIGGLGTIALAIIGPAGRAARRGAAGGDIEREGGLDRGGHGEHEGAVPIRPHGHGRAEQIDEEIIGQSGSEVRCHAAEV